MDVSSLTQRFKSLLKERLPETVYQVWFSDFLVQATGEKLIFEVANEFAKNWLKEHYGDLLGSIGKELGFEQYDFKVVSKKNPQQLIIPYSPLEIFGRKISPRYTLEDFVVGKCNELAHKVSYRVVEEPPRGGLIFFSGNYGLGKTHLSQGIANGLLRKGYSRIFYFTAQDFLSCFMKYLKSGSLDHFKRKIQEECDLLILDGLHYLSGKEFTQVELAFLLDYLLDYGKNVILTSIRPPKDLVNFDSTLKSRLNAGLLLKLNQPDFETRKKIIRFKAKKLGYQFPYEVVEYIARMVREDVRQLESVVNGIIARAKLLHEPISLLLAKELLQEMDLAKEEGQDLEIFLEKVCRFFGVEKSSLLSFSRKKKLILARQALIYLLKKYSRRNLKEIAEIFKKEHSTILYHLRMVEKRLAEDKNFKLQIELLKREILEELNLPQTSAEKSPEEEELNLQSL